LRKIQRLNESPSQRGRSLWEAVLTFIVERPVVTRQELLDRFARDEPLLLRGVLHDLTESGLVFSSGMGATAVYRALSAEELTSLRGIKEGSGFDELLWVFVFREGPMTRPALLERAGGSSPAADSALERLIQGGRIRELDDGSLSAAEFVVTVDAEAGWEAAVFDHYHALVKTICARLGGEQDPALPRSATGGSTYTFDVWLGHPYYEEVVGLLDGYRKAVGGLRERVERHNAQHAIPARFLQVVTYAGQCALFQEGMSDENY